MINLVCRAIEFIFACVLSLLELFRWVLLGDTDNREENDDER